MKRPLLLSGLIAASLLAGCGGDQGSTSADRPRQMAAAPQQLSIQQHIFTGVVDNYTITQDGDFYLVTDNTGKDATMRVASTARLRFADTSLSFDATGLPGQAYRLYRAAFAREPDVGGLGFWIGKLGEGVSLNAMTQGFIQSPEYLALYANTKTSTEIVNQYYVNVLGRQGEPGGVTFWTDVLDAKSATLAEVLLAFSASDENKAGTAALINKGFRYQETGVSYPARGFPLRTSYARYANAPRTEYLTISGYCQGYAAYDYATPASVAFEGSSAVSLQNAVSVGLTTCNPSSMNWSTADYFDSNGNLLGHAETGTEYDVSAGTAGLPASARIGDQGVVATQSSYADSGKQGTPGKRVLSYALEADAESASGALLTLTAVHTPAQGAATLTRISRFRVSSDGVMSPLNTEETYSSGVHLLYTNSPASAQPAALSVTDTLVGSGATAQAGNTLSVHYTGWLYVPGAAGSKGTQFDSSVGKSPFTFKLGTGYVIQGWDQGMAGMKVGGKRTLIIPSSLGYGTKGAGALIPGNSPLVFEVELLSVK